MGDIESGKGRGGGDEVAVPDLCRHASDSVLGEVPARSALIEPLLHLSDLRQHCRVGELPVGTWMSRHERKRFAVGHPAELPGDLAEPPAALVLSKPLREVMKPARIAVDPAAAIA